MSESDNYKTPRWLKTIFRNWYDPCPFNPTPKFDGLKAEWPERIYINPPYSNVEPWVDKAIEESKKGKKIVMLLPVDTSTNWFKKLIVNKAHIFWHYGRIKFSTEAPRFASMLVILNHKAKKEIPK